MIDLNSTNKIITIHRGDTFGLYLKLNLGDCLDTEYYEMQEGDCLYFGLMEPFQKFENALLKKVFNYDDYKTESKQVNLYFSTEDTEHLVSGTYYYQIKLYIKKDETFNNLQSVETIIPKTKFIILD